jgi:GNAT superfamily N-acetyltransferase
VPPTRPRSRSSNWSTATPPPRARIPAPSRRRTRISTKPPDPQRIAIRAARAADIPRLVAIRSSVRENRLSSPIAAADYEPYVAGGRCWVAEAAGAILGFAALDSGAASVWALFVDPAAEGRGAGRRLLGALVADARRRALPELRLTTAQGSRAERLYGSAGWTEAAREPDGILHLRLDLRT